MRDDGTRYRGKLNVPTRYVDLQVDEKYFQKIFQKINICHREQSITCFHLLYAF